MFFLYLSVYGAEGHVDQEVQTDTVAFAADASSAMPGEGRRWDRRGGGRRAWRDAGREGEGRRWDRRGGEGGRCGARWKEMKAAHDNIVGAVAVFKARVEDLRGNVADPARVQHFIDNLKAAKDHFGAALVAWQSAPRPEGCRGWRRGEGSRGAGGSAADPTREEGEGLGEGRTGRWAAIRAARDAFMEEFQRLSGQFDSSLEDATALLGVADAMIVAWDAFKDRRNEEDGGTGSGAAAAGGAAASSAASSDGM